MTYLFYLNSNFKIILKSEKIINIVKKNKLKDLPALDKTQSLLTANNIHVLDANCHTSYIQFQIYPFLYSLRFPLIPWSAHVKCLAVLAQWVQYKRLNRKKESGNNSLRLIQRLGVKKYDKKILGSKCQKFKVQFLKILYLAKLSILETQLKDVPARVAAFSRSFLEE